MQESGFVHSAFTFVYESMLGRSNIRNADKSIPPGALISFLQKGLQYVGIEEGLQQDGSKARKSANTGGTGTTNEAAGFSLLSPQTIGALTRENPPIQLNVPPATAAAAVKARLEAEAKMAADRKVAAFQAGPSSSSSNNGRNDIAITGPSSIPPQPRIEEQNRNGFGAQAAAAANAMNQLQQQQEQQQNNNATAERSTTSVESAGAAAFMAQQRRVVAGELAAIKEQQQLQKQQLQRQIHQQELQQQQDQLQQQLQQQLRQEQLQQQQLQQRQQERMFQADAAAALASVAEQVGNKRSAGNSKKGPKNKMKASKHQRMTPPETDALHLMSQPAPGFASLEEAVARLEASSNNNGGAEKVESSSTSNQQEIGIPMDLEENDQPAASSSADPAHVGLGQAVPIPSSQELMNGQRMDLNGQEELVPGNRLPLNGGHHLSNHSVMAAGVQSIPSKLNRSDKSTMKERHPDEATTSKADPTIDREDELTNALPSEVLELKMHSSEVFMCAWNPIFTDMIATGSGDASARIWQMNGAKAAAGLGPVRLLPHGTGPRDRKNKDVTTLEWSSDGKLLATGSYDGVARVWSRSGALVHTLRGHKGPIFSLKWNKRGNYLLSGSYDKTTIVWDVSGSTGFVEQQFNDHQAPALDVDWKDDTTFASCSTDKTVHICRVGVPRPLKTYTGHTDEVNAVKWDPSGTLLASCSDDCTAKVWDVGSDRRDPMQDFKSHQQEIYTVKW
jgi:hypothetical protein